MINQVLPVILSGGSGTRLWPLSRTGFPKQFLCLTGKESLFQMSVNRLKELGNDQISIVPPYVVCNEQHRFLVLEQLREINVHPSSIILEPVGRNTAPALTLAAIAAIENGEDPILVVTPADQIIKDQDSFTVALQNAICRAMTDAIVLLAVTPSRPETGYGYIKTAYTKPSSSNALKVDEFVEKPDVETAKKYLDEGNYYWNAGIFVLKASLWIKALKYFRPDIANNTDKAWSTRSIDNFFIRPGEDEFTSIPSESIDYAVMEHCAKGDFKVEMVPLDAGWNDLGAWDAVWSVLPKDETGNTNSGDVIITDCRNTLVHATSRLVSLIGVEDLMVIETPDVVLVADKFRSQDVKLIVNKLDQSKRDEQNLHRKVHRPWGWYDSIDCGENFKVKRIRVNPLASLSLQRHHHRAEHWIVVKGTAEVVCGNKRIVLNENQSTYIPLGEAHRLSNPAAIPLELIEVQSGSYLGEDDIERIEDQYGR